MNANLDERMRTALVGLADGVRPQPDPYGRVLSRSRRGRLRWRAAIGAFVAAALAGTGVYALSPGGPVDPPPVMEPFDIYNDWANRLADTPTMGSVGADREFVADFARRVGAHRQAGDYDRGPASVLEIKVPFVEDVGAYRYAFVVFVLTAPDPTTKWPNASAWAVAPRGASAETLAGPDSIRGLSDGSEPAPDEWLDGDVEIGLAPAGCTYATAALPAVSDWRLEPTGSYIIRTPAQRRPEWWRITCDGVVRSERPARAPFVDGPITAAQLDQGLAPARGTIERERVRPHLQQAASWTTHNVAEMPRVVWAGPLADGYAVILSAPLVGGGFVGQVQIRYDPARADGTIGTAYAFYLDWDPTAADTTVVVPLGEDVPELLVVPPAGTASVRDDANGQPVPVTAGAAVLRVPPDQRADLSITALRADGMPIGRGKMPSAPRGAVIDRWDIE